MCRACAHAGVHDTPSSKGNMVSIPGGAFRFSVTGIEIEDGGNVYWPSEDMQLTTTAGNGWTQPMYPHAACGDSYASAREGAAASPCPIKFDPTQVDVQYEWEPHPSRFHAQWIHLKPFLLDKFPVTQQNYSEFLVASGGERALPVDRYHYLKNWDWSGPMPVPKPGNEKLPVTYIGVSEARAYCSFMAKRLPHEEEWQAAGQGRDSERIFPWDVDQHPNASAMMPEFQMGHSFAGPEPVDAHSPGSDSAYGVADMLGNVWQMTGKDRRTAMRDSFPTSLLLGRQAPFVLASRPIVRHI